MRGQVDVYLHLEVVEMLEVGEEHSLAMHLYTKKLKKKCFRLHKSRVNIKVNTNFQPGPEIVFRD